MTEIQSREHIADALAIVAEQISTDVSAMTDAQFNAGTEFPWSAAGYLKHLLITMKMFGRGFRMSQEQLATQFGVNDSGESKTFDELVVMYDAKMATGWQAPTPVVPVNYRMPEGIADEKACLLETWQTVNQQILDLLQNWSEADLDTYQIPHQAIGVITMREMLFFNVHHNREHQQDIVDAARS
ncbi:MAG: DinB family protein [Aggregatilineales bacterium]